MVWFIDQKGAEMKPTIRSTAGSFLALGTIAFVLGFTGLPQPIMLAGGLAAVLAGVGLYLRFRRAWTLGAVYAVINLAISGFRLYRGITGGGEVVMPAVWLLIDLYLLLSLVAIRARFFKD
jgi:hypothetical protein